jgi:FlaA1/EpsC-like NDP-sugar epimerase
MSFTHRTLRRTQKTVLDVLAFTVAYYLAYAIRFEGRIPADAFDLLQRSLPWVLVLKVLCLVAYKIPGLTWRYTALPEARSLALATVTAGGLLGLLRLAPGFRGIPLGVLLIDALLGAAATIGLRLGARCWSEAQRRAALGAPGGGRVPTLLIGAGQAGALVAKEVGTRDDLPIRPVGFLDDDPGKLGMRIHGLEVLGGTAELRRVAKEYSIGQALITIGHLSGPEVRRVTGLCAECGIPAKMIPGIGEMVEGRVNLSAIRDVAIEDLLRRDPVNLENQTIAGILNGRNVLVSGAGGSIGSELCREICRFGPRLLLAVEQAENSLFHIHRRLIQEFPGLEIVPCVADICDTARMEYLFSCWEPLVVFHAAAHKHVPLMESNPGEAVKNNVLGTRQLADLAHAHGVERFVMISTDKAVRPSSIMGASKRIAETYIQALSQRSETSFVTVRFGNVLGSAGSVVPLFKEQIARGGPVTITHPAMVRYFMTIPEACQMVLQAGAMGRGGEIFILDMGKPVKIVDLARDLIRLSGLSPEDVEIKFTGIRPGEKLFEELSLTRESIQKTRHPKIFIGQHQGHDWEQITRQVEELRALVDGADLAPILDKIKEIVPEYRHNGWAEAETQTAPDAACRLNPPQLHPPDSRGLPVRPVGLVSAT